MVPLYIYTVCFNIAFDLVGNCVYVWVCGCVWGGGGCACVWGGGGGAAFSSCPNISINL